MLRKHLVSLIIGVSLLILPRVSLASLNDFRGELESVTNHLNHEAGIYVVSFDRGEVLYSKNATTPLNPASVTKLLTAAAALKFLGPDYRFHTRFYITPENDLYIYGEGDPTFVIEDMRTVVWELKRNGLRGLRHILVDDSYFSDYTSPGLPGRKGISTPYTGALSLNFNRIDIYVTPGKRVGDNAQVKADAGEIAIDVDDRVITKRGRKGAYITFESPRHGEDRFTVSGHIPIQGKTRGYEVYVGLPPLYFAEALKALLKEKGIAVSGAIYRGEGLKDASLILDHKSEPLSKIIKDMNKFSNNFIAEQITKVLGAKYVGIPGSTGKGIAVFQKYLSTIGVQSRNYYLVNGSGLSYDNRLSAEQITKVVYDMFKDKKLWPYFEDSLSIAGKDGTLKRRYRSSPLYDRLRAKTGTVEGVRAIAGTIPSVNNETIGFAVIINGNENLKGYHELQNKIATALASFER